MSTTTYRRGCARRTAVDFTQQTMFLKYVNPATIRCATLVIYPMIHLIAPTAPLGRTINWSMDRASAPWTTLSLAVPARPAIKLIQVASIAPTTKQTANCPLTPHSLLAMNATKHWAIL
jgi:hypothetical protein